MNILILSWRGPKHPNAGGAELVTFEHARNWVKAGYKVTLFTSFYNNAEKKEEVIDGVKIIRRGGQVLGVRLAAFWWYLFGRHPKFDIVVDEFHGIPFFTPLYVKVKKLAYIHEVAKEVWLLNPWPKPFNLLPAIGKYFEPYIFKTFYKNIFFMTVSNSTKKDLVNWGIPSKNITVIHNGVTLNLPHPLPRKERRKTAIFLGVLTKDKGIEEAIKAFGLINQTDPNWQFWVVGKGSLSYIQKLKKLAKSLKILGKIRFWGYVSEKKKFELLARAHVSINPSIREGWGLVNIEANAVGTPVVAYNVPGCRDSIKNGKTGFLSKPGDYRSLAENSLKLVNSSENYKKFQKGALSWSQKFRWEKATNQSKNFLKKIVS